MNIALWRAFISSFRFAKLRYISQLKRDSIGKNFVQCNLRNLFNISGEIVFLSNPSNKVSLFSTARIKTNDSCFRSIINQ